MRDFKSGASRGWGESFGNIEQGGFRGQSGDREGRREDWGVEECEMELKHWLNLTDSIEFTFEKVFKEPCWLNHLLLAKEYTMKKNHSRRSRRE